MNLQETIKQVLREESEKKSFKKDVQDYIDKNGFRETKKMLGMTTLSLVKLLDLHIDSGLANEILLENITNGKLPTKYKEFTIFGSRMENVVYWAVITKTGHFSDDLTERIDFVATPLWDGESYTPIELDYYALVDKDGYGLFSTHSEGSMYYRTLKGQSEFESVEELFTWYEEFYLPEVYSMIMDTILPRVHDYADYELGNKR
jgi:hypothetical protein